MIVDRYAKWRKRLEIAQQHATVAGRREALKAAGIMTYMQPELDDAGFYRLPLTEPAISKVTGHRNGRQFVIGYEPVVYYCDENGIRGAIGNRDMTADEIGDLWTHVCGYPISEEEYHTMTGDAPAKGWGES